MRSTQGTFENLVEWTRIESGQVASAPTIIPAGDILAALAQEFSAEAARRGIAFRWVTSRTAIACDPVLVRRTLKQLLDYYADSLVTVDAVGEVEEINARALAALGK